MRIFWHSEWERVEGLESTADCELYKSLVWCMSQSLQVQMGSEINRLSYRGKFSQG